MQGRAILIVALVISVLSTGMPFGSSTATEPHLPIAVDGDGAFAACACVRSGAGTAADPFVISGWSIETTFGTAVSIRNVATTHFVVRDNTLRSFTGVSLTNTGDRGHVLMNTITAISRGVDVALASPDIAGNTLLARTGATPLLVRLEASNARVLNNLFQGPGTGVEARSSTPTIANNRFIGQTTALLLTETTTATVDGNVVNLVAQTGIRVAARSEATLTGNLIDEGRAGIVVQDSVLTLIDNQVSNQKAEAVRFERSKVTMVANHVSDNFAGAVGAEHSNVQLLDNVFENSQAEALRLEAVEGTVQANTLRLNGVGIALARSIVTLRDNVLEDNTVGLSVPYDSRQSIPLMAGNRVNGLNVDGTLVPAHKALYYMEKNLVVSGRVFDSGAGGGFSGQTIGEGALVIYDSTDIIVEQNAFATTDAGIRIAASERITVRDNDFIDVHVGVHAIDSVVFIKRNDCDLRIDPVATVCIRVVRGFAVVANNTMLRFATGIDWQGAKGVAEDNTALRGGVGIRAAGGALVTGHDVLLHRNQLDLNVDGLVLSDFRGVVRGNTAGNNSDSGITMAAGTNATVEANIVVRNGVGIDDETPCSGSGGGCSGGVFVSNRAIGNAGAGIRVRGGGVFRSNLAVDNAVGIHVDHDARFDGDAANGNRLIGIRGNGTIGMVDVVAQDNGRHDGHGIVIVGHARLWDVVARRNAQVGVIVCGSADAMMGNYSSNGEEGMHLQGSVFNVADVEASFNGLAGIRSGGEVCAVPRIVITIPSLPSIGVPNAPQEDKDPLFLHGSDLVGNGVYALQADAKAVVDARDNYWGPLGPVTSNEAFRTGTNLVSPNALTTPYFADRDHTDRRFAPKVDPVNLGP